MSDLLKKISEFFFNRLRQECILSIPVLWDSVLDNNDCDNWRDRRCLCILETISILRCCEPVYWVGIIFVTFALLFAILGYLSELNARDDLLTPLRRELVGFWQV